MNFTESQRKKLLGAYYIRDFANCSDKSLLLNTINDFINSNKEHKPIITLDEVSANHKSCIYSFFRNNEDILPLNLKLFKYGYYSNIKDGGNYTNNDVIIGYDTKTNLKKVYVSRGYNGLVKEMSTVLGIRTLRELYKMFVYDVISIKFLLMRKKVHYELYKKITDNTLFSYMNGDNIHLVQFEPINTRKYSIHDDIMYFKRKITYFSYYENGDAKTESITHTLYDNNQIDNFFETFNEKYKKITNIEDIKEIIKFSYTKRIEDLNMKMEKSLEYANNITFFNKN